MHPSANAPQKCTMLPPARTDGIDVQFFKEDSDGNAPILHEAMAPGLRLLERDGLQNHTVNQSARAGRKDVSFSENASRLDLVDAASNNPPTLGEGAMARDLQLLQQDLLDSHRRVLGILEPHVQGATHVEAEMAALRAENQRLNDQLKLLQREPEPTRGSQLALGRNSIEAFAPTRGSLSQQNALPDASNSLGGDGSIAKPSCNPSSKARVSLRVSEPQIAESIAIRSGNSPRLEEEGCDTQGLRSTALSPESDSKANGKGKSVRNTNTATKKSAVSQYWDILTKPTVERRVTALQRQTMSDGGAQDSSEEPEEEQAMMPLSTDPAEVLGWRKRLRKIIAGNAFEMVFGIIIVSNSLFIGLEVDYTAANPTDDIPISYQLVAYLYTAVFTFELILRLIADCRGFLCTNINQMMWNYLDILIVASSLAEVALDVIKAASAGSQEGGVNLSNLRIIRIIRITKLMRLFRIARIVKFVRALRTLIMSILSTLKSVFWSLLLLTVIIYCFAIMFTQAASDYSVEVMLGSREAILTVSESDRLRYFWGSLPESMLALFMSVSGGVSWVDVTVPLRKVDASWLYMFLIYISFVYFAVLNVVTGIFCQSAIESQQNDQEAMVQAYLSNKRLFTDRFVKLFKAVDSDDSGQVTRTEFEKHLKDPKVEAYFATLGIDPSDARGLFRLLEANGDEGLDIEEFVHGCLRLKGQARSADLARLMHDHKTLAREVTQMIEFIKEHYSHESLL